MPDLINNPNKRDFRMRYRAFCSDDSFLGRWQSDEQAAEDDAANHLRNHPGHNVEIEIEQKGIVPFKE